MSHHLGLYADSKSYTVAENELWSELSSICFSRISEYAHPSCLKGVMRLGLIMNKVPSLELIGRRLLPFGWSVEPADGLISPREFFSYLSRRILPVALTLRSKQSRDYSPDPDIFHEIFGHACMLVDSKYSDCLQKFGEISLKAFELPEDKYYYSNLSVLAKEKSKKAAAYEVDVKMNDVSEATMLARLGWWSFECGLVNYQGKIKVYGAALLSSPEEIVRAVNFQNTRSLTLDCTRVAYDPTEMQSSYFVTSSFDELFVLLEHMSKGMAFKVGGIYGVEIAMKSGQVSVLEFSSGRSKIGVIASYAEKFGHLTEVIFKDGSSCSIAVDEELLSVYPWV